MKKKTLFDFYLALLFQVPTGGSVTISTPMLLDVNPPPLDKVTIDAGGQLVFDPSVESLKLTASMVELTGGELWIGSEGLPLRI